MEGADADTEVVDNLEMVEDGKQVKAEVTAEDVKQDAKRVLLHGATDLPWLSDEPRRSLEMRFTIQTTPEAAASDGVVPAVSDSEEAESDLALLFNV